MSKLARKGKGVMLFNIYGDNLDGGNMGSEHVALMPLDLGPEIETCQLPELISQDGKLQDYANLARSVLVPALEKGSVPILNIEFDSNKAKSIIDAQYIKSLKELGIRVSFTFADYNAEEKKLRDIWQPLLDQADHVFFAKEQDRDKAVAAGHLSFYKADYPLEMLLAAKLDSQEILKRPANILLRGPFKDLATIHESTKAAKELGNDTKVIIDAFSASSIDLANAITAKFTIENAEDLMNFREGLRLEIDEILQGKDKVACVQKLEKYVKQLTKQFEQDKQASKINNIIEINFDQVRSNDIHKQAKYIITEQAEEYYRNGCIHLQASSNLGIINEVKEREAHNVINEDSISQMQEILNDQSKQVFIRKLVDFFKNIDTGGKQENLDVVPITPDNLIDASHLYEDYEIYALLNASLDPDKVHIQFPCKLDDKIGLQSVVTKAVESIKGGKKDAIIPIDTGGHWVGLMVSKNEDNKLVFTYQDPAGSDIEGRSGLKEAIIKANYNSSIKDQPVIQQFGDVNCGVYLVDNLIKSVDKEAILRPSNSDIGTGLRRKHAAILKDKEQKEKLKEEAVKLGSGILSSAMGKRNLSPLKPTSSYKGKSP